MWGSGGQSIVTERWRCSEYPKGKRKRPPELFDQQEDPGELRNLAQDPAHTDVVKELSALLQGGWRACLPKT